MATDAAAMAAADSLVRYKPPVLVSHSLRTPPDKGAPEPPQELLNTILPPRVWEEKNRRWVQEVSSVPSTRVDVMRLQEQLDRRLRERQARENGICPVRRELYRQCFDELIREITINCAERGLLLLRVRDEIQMTLDTYETLYQSSTAFGVRKALQAAQDKCDMEKRIAELEEEKRELERQVSEEKAKCEATEKRGNERQQLEAKKHAEEVQFLKQMNQQLKAQLESIIAVNK